MNIKNPGTWLVIASLLAGLPACGGTAKNAAAHGNYMDDEQEGSEAIGSADSEILPATDGTDIAGKDDVIAPTGPSDAPAPTGLLFPVFTVTPVYNLEILKGITDAMQDNEVKLTATLDGKNFSVVRLHWDVNLPQDQIEELYVWSDKDFNRRAGDGNVSQGVYDATAACGLIENEDASGKVVDKRYLIVPSGNTGAWFNEGSKDADLVKELLRGKGCDNNDGDSSNDCVDYAPAKESIACRMDLKTADAWRLHEGIATLVGGAGDRDYVLVLKKKSGTTIVKKATVNVSEPTTENATGQNLIGLDESRADALYARVRFHYESVDPRTQIAVLFQADGGALQACEQGEVEVPASGAGEVDALCRLGDDTKLSIHIAGRETNHYRIQFGLPKISVVGLKEKQLYAPTTTALSYQLARTWSYSHDQSEEITATGNLTENQALKSLKSTELLCYSFYEGVSTPCGKIKDGKGLVITDVPLSHDQATYVVRVTTASGKQVESMALGFIIVPAAGAQKYFTQEKLSGVECKSTPLTCYYSCGQGGYNTCTTHDLRFDGLSQTFLLKMQHVKSLSWKCGAGAAATVVENQNGVQKTLSSGFKPADPYTVTVLTATITSPKLAGGCGFEVERYYNSPKSNGGMETVYVTADDCEGGYTNTDPDYFSGLNLDHCE